MIVDDDNCPGCGGEGSPKVGDEFGNWWWKCFSSYQICKVGYWLPETGEVEYKLEPEEHAKRMAEIDAKVAAQLDPERGRWVDTDNGNGIISSQFVPWD